MLKEALIMIAAVIAGNWLWENKIFVDWSIGKQIGLLVFLFIAYLILNAIYENFETGSLNNDDADIDNDIFLDNAPNPVPPPTNPPASEQIEFAEFMKKQREQEREKSVVRRE